MNEASARIKINKLLEEAGWRFFADGRGAGNIQLEPNASFTSATPFRNGHSVRELCRAIDAANYERVVLAKKKSRQRSEFCGRAPATGSRTATSEPSVTFLPLFMR
ncbi:MAG: hypothetical protein K9N23_23330 [Akkermansiaceae bacterium]|nr:hypothetical protein [Akkermansiaceae bacterium]